ncbi:1,4-dihydroxy-2-naphthoate octaprenyltransferase [Costertonia aggregata]|uniref:1,4-dihydroxy-2-naphthoate octaprenyltransferase n=1 Tax=Costertonia aggregata TaxID=343403 RepID=A0A7H9AUK8_9FLAO|nr:1,4-dihydroxy-2-naphthoate octaprenyltransferase [Costertonia aggregata]QLG47159.1 1,4-dihydroxy-2-naphthoate octaprenyltransferase [Costertonia aggregata]
MSKFKAWVNAARLRTLPLSISGILVGTALANFYGYSNTVIFILALLTTIGFQVTSNFANDYGDGVKGTDNDERIGPKRAYQSGLLSRKELKKGIIVSIMINLVLVLFVVYFSFGTENLDNTLVFLILGLASVWAAIRYTVGNSAYGYKGLGDVFVFLFFGLLGVVGSMFLFTKNVTLLSFLPAIAIGTLSTAVLNLNNLRDHISDKKSNKNTLVVFMGFENGKVYHYVLILVAFICMLCFTLLNKGSLVGYVHLLAFIPMFIHLIKVYKTEEPRSLDVELKKLALSTFLLALLFYLCYNYFL